MLDMPRIKIELEGLKANVTSLFNTHNAELTEYVVSEIERQITAEWVTMAVADAVRDCLRGAIKDVTNNSALKYALQDSIAQAIVEKLHADT